jgi:hypothetical protein
MTGEINRSNRTGFTNQLHAAISPIKKRASDTLAKIQALFRKQPEIFHLGGTRLGSVDLANTQKRMDEGYFYERIPVQTSKGEVFIYGNTLKPYVKNWMKDSRSGAFDGTFQEYMETHPDLETLAASKVRYLSPQEQKQTEVSIVDGHLCQPGLDSTDTQPMNLPKGKYAFVIADIKDENGKLKPQLFAALKGDTSTGKIQHSSFARGGNVISAGTFEVESGGKIARISNFSGHYRPTKKELFLCLDYLQKNGYDLQQCYVQHYANTLFMGLAHIIPIKGFAAVLMRADKWMAQYTPS